MKNYRMQMKKIQCKWIRSNIATFHMPYASPLNNRLGIVMQQMIGNPGYAPSACPKSRAYLY